MRKASKDTLLKQKVGRLTVLRFIGTDSRKHKDRLRVRYLYECRCECGNLSIVNRNNLKSRSTLSCGCLRREKVLLGHKKQKGQIREKMRKPNGESALRSTFLAYKAGAKKRKLIFELSFETFSQLTKRNCTFCGTEPNAVWRNSAGSSTYIANGIDRLDPNLGYTVDNCAPCCKTCNFMKHTLSKTDFISHIFKIKNFLQLKLNLEVFYLTHSETRLT